MTRKYVYLALFIIGTIVPLLSFVPWVLDHGVDISLMLDELFANRISAFFGLDVIVSSLVFWVFANWEGKRVGVTWIWLPVLASLIVGLSSGLPLFLFLRESRLQPTTKLGA